MDMFHYLVMHERERQDRKFGTNRHIPNGTGDIYYIYLANADRNICDAAFKNGRGTWQHILQEEVSEAFAESDPAKLKEELVQVAAVCKAWIEDLDRSSERSK